MEPLEEVLFGLGLVLAVIGHIWLLVALYRTNPTAVLFYMFIPFGWLHYQMSNWSETHKPFLLFLVGLLLALVAVFLAVGT